MIMRRLFLFVTSILVVLGTSCSFDDIEASWYDKGFEIEFAEDETDNPYSPWLEVREPDPDPAFRLVGSDVRYKIFVHDSEGNNLLAPDSPLEVVLNYLKDGEVVDFDYSGMYGLAGGKNGEEECYISLISSWGSWLLVWKNGWPDDRIVCRTEYTKDKTHYRYYFLLNGNKQYEREFYLVK